MSCQQLIWHPYQQDPKAEDDQLEKSLKQYNFGGGKLFGGKSNFKVEVICGGKRFRGEFDFGVKVI